MIADVNCQLKTPKRGQSAQCPDRLLRKSGGSFRQIFWE